MIDCFHCLLGITFSLFSGQVRETELAVAAAIDFQNAKKAEEELAAKEEARRRAERKEAERTAQRKKPSSRRRSGLSSDTDESVVEIPAATHRISEEREREQRKKRRKLREKERDRGGSRPKLMYNDGRLGLQEEEMGSDQPMGVRKKKREAHTALSSSESDPADKDSDQAAASLRKLRIKDSNVGKGENSAGTFYVKSILKIFFSIGNLT